jgi:SAM-dependent methyltransferase
MGSVPSGLAGHPDRLRWNAKYQDGAGAGRFSPHPLAVRALSPPDGPPPDGPVLELACGPSGSALAAAAAGRQVTAVDISDVALGLLEREAGRRGLSGLITLVHADLRAWRPRPRSYALVLCTGCWDRDVFGPAAEAVTSGGLLGWEAFTMDARRARPSLPAEWCLRPGEPASLLPGGFSVVQQRDLPDGDGTSHAGAPKRRMLARRG